MSDDENIWKGVFPKREGVEVILERYYGITDADELIDQLLPIIEAGLFVEALRLTQLFRKEIDVERASAEKGVNKRCRPKDGRTKPMTDDEKKTIRDLDDREETIAYIAAEINRHANTVSRYLNNLEK